MRHVALIAFVALFACSKTQSADDVDASVVMPGSREVDAAPVDGAAEGSPAACEGGRPPNAASGLGQNPVAGCGSCTGHLQCCAAPDAGRECYFGAYCAGREAERGCLAASECQSQVATQCCDEREKTGKTACRPSCAPGDAILCSLDSECPAGQACRQVSGLIWTCQPCP